MSTSIFHGGVPLEKFGRTTQGTSEDMVVRTLPIFLVAYKNARDKTAGVNKLFPMEPNQYIMT